MRKVKQVQTPQIPTLDFVLNDVAYQSMPGNLALDLWEVANFIEDEYLNFEENRPNS